MGQPPSVRSSLATNPGASTKSNVARPTTANLPIAFLHLKLARDIREHPKGNDSHRDCSTSLTLPSAYTLKRSVPALLDAVTLFLACPGQPSFCGSGKCMNLPDCAQAVWRQYRSSSSSACVTPRSIIRGLPGGSPPPPGGIADQPSSPCLQLVDRTATVRPGWARICWPI
jgi:hypothetical protein